MSIKSYYSFNKILSLNATINCVVGGRGLGKTFGAKDKVIKDSTNSVEIIPRTVITEDKRGKEKHVEILEPSPIVDQFIYLRRYKEELAMAKATFFADIEYKFPKWNFRINGWEAQASPVAYSHMDKGRPWATIGYFIALSVAQNYKSVQFPNVKWILFDEFIIEKGGQYLPEEASKFMNFYNTVDRYKDKTRVFMLANSVTITNPYFIQYRIEPQKADKNGFIKVADGFMACHFPESKDFENEVYQTKFGKFIAETDPEYAEYAIGNQFRDNHTGLLNRKPYSATYLVTLETKTGVFSVWYDIKTGMYFCQEKRPVGNEDIVTLVPEYMTEGKRLGVFTDKSLSGLRTAFRHDRMRFDRAPTRNAFMEIFKR